MHEEMEEALKNGKECHEIDELLIIFLEKLYRKYKKENINIIMTDWKVYGREVEKRIKIKELKEGKK